MYLPFTTFLVDPSDIKLLQQLPIFEQGSNLILWPPSLFPFLLTLFTCISYWLSSSFCCDYFCWGALSRKLVTYCIEFMIIIMWVLQ